MFGENITFYVSQEPDILSQCSKMHSLYHDKMNKVFKDNTTLVNNNTCLKYITEYTFLCLGYMYEISLLQVLNWNTSIHVIARSFFESFAIAKNFIKEYANFEEYFKFLLLKDSAQDLIIYKDILSLGSKYEEVSESYINRFENILKKFDITINNNPNRKDQIIEHLNILINNYENKFPAISVLIDEAIISIKVEGQRFVDGKVIYRQLCHDAHNSISSIDDRLIHDGKIILNVPSKNTKAILQLIILSIENLYTEILTLCTALKN